MDVSKYFDNIDKQILLKILKRKIQDKDIIWIEGRIEEKQIVIKELTQ